MKHKGPGHTGHKHEIAKAHGHKPDPKPKANAAFGTQVFGKGGGSLGEHDTHRAANAHHNMHQGMAPDGEHGTLPMSGSHLGQNEWHGDAEGQGEASAGEGDMGADHAGGESDEG